MSAVCCDRGEFQSSPVSQLVSLLWLLGLAMLHFNTTHITTSITPS